MTDHVTRKAFKNGGSVAVRIPKGWLEEDAEIEIMRRDDGIVEIRTLDREARMRKLLEYLSQQPELPDDAFPVPDRNVEPSRFDYDEMFRD